MIRIVVTALLAIAIGCAEEDVASPRSVGPSPLPAFDSDRLWILLNANGMADVRCKDYYRGEAALRDALRGRCTQWEKDIVAYLRLNGLPTLEVEHMREPYFYDWYLAKSEAISDCVSQIPPTSSENLRKRNACNPWEDVAFNKKLSSEKLGIVFPPRE